MIIYNDYEENTLIQVKIIETLSEQDILDEFNEIESVDFESGNYGMCEATLHKNNGETIYLKNLKYVPSIKRLFEIIKSSFNKLNNDGFITIDCESEAGNED